MGLYFGIRPATQLLATALCIFLLKIISRPLLAFLGLLITVVGLLLFGPSATFYLPNSLSLSCIGYGILGFGNGLSLMPILPELINYFIARRILSSNKAADVTSALGDLTGGQADLFAPLIGSLLDSALGFRYASDLALLLAILALICFGIWGGGFSSLCTLCCKRPVKTESAPQHEGSNSTRKLVATRPKADSVVLAKLKMQRKLAQQNP